MEGVRGGRDKDAKKVMTATGANYTVALNEVIRRREALQSKYYMLGINSMPLWQEGQPIKCVRCLAPEHGKCNR